jgi:hypothetical protein
MAGSQIDIGLGVRDNTRQAFDKFQRQLSHLKNDVTKKFSTVDIGKQILGGLGIGSGFALAQTAVEKLTGYFREQADLAQIIEESTAQQLAHTKQLIALRQSPQEQLNTLQRDYDTAKKELATLRSEESRTTTLKANPLVGNKEMTLVRDMTAEEAKAIKEKAAEVNRLELQVKALDKTLTDAAISSHIAEEDRKLADSAEKAETAYRDLNAEVSRFVKNGLLPQIDAEQKNREQKQEVDAALDRMAESYRELADPMAVYERRLREIDKLEKKKFLTPDAAMGARISVYGQQADAINARNDTRSPAQVRGEIDGIVSETEALSDAARDLGFAFSSAFEDAVIGGNKLGDVLRGLGQDILRMGLRLGITNPLLNSVFSLTGASALPTLGFKAAGGPVNAGSPYIVGENGPELFTPSQAGRIIPNHAMGGGSGGGGASVFNFSYNFASGVQRQEIAGMLPELIEASKRAVMDAAQRGGAFRRALA